VPDLLTVRKWTDSQACKLRLACRACRENPAFCAAVVDRYELPPAWLACPFGILSGDLSATAKHAAPRTQPAMSQHSVCPTLSPIAAASQASAASPAKRWIQAFTKQDCTYRMSKESDGP